VISLDLHNHNNISNRRVNNVCVVCKERPRSKEEKKKFNKKNVLEAKNIVNKYLFSFSANLISRITS